MPVDFRAGTSQVTPEEVRNDSNTYCGLAGKYDEGGGRGSSEGVNMNAVLEKDLLEREAEDAAKMTEVALDAMQSPVTTVGYDWFVLKERYLELVRALTDKIQKA